MARDAAVGDHVAAARSLPMTGNRRWPRRRILVLADLIAKEVCHPSTFSSIPRLLGAAGFVTAVEHSPTRAQSLNITRSCSRYVFGRIDREHPPGTVKWTRRNSVFRHAKNPSAGAKSSSYATATLHCCSPTSEGDGGLSMAGHVIRMPASLQLASEVRRLLLRLGVVGTAAVAGALRGRETPTYVITVRRRTVAPVLAVYRPPFYGLRKRRNPGLWQRFQGLAACLVTSFQREVRDLIRRGRSRARLPVSGSDRRLVWLLAICSRSAAKIEFRRL